MNTNRESIEADMMFVEVKIQVQKGSHGDDDILSEHVIAVEN